MRISSPYIAKHEDYQYLSPHAKTCISRIEFIILELSINNKLNNEHEVKKSERGKRGYRKGIMNKQEINESIEKENPEIKKFN
ncbi:MAG: hypothetical protein ACLUTU_13355 [Blautia faecis]